MKATLQTVYSSKLSVDKLLRLRGVNARVGYKIAKVLKPIQDEIAMVDKFINELFNKYGGTSQDDPNKRSILAENVEAYNKEITELIETEIELPNKKIKMEFIEDTTDLTPEDFILLNYLLEE